MVTGTVATRVIRGQGPRGLGLFHQVHSGIPATVMVSNGGERRLCQSPRPPSRLNAQDIKVALWLQEALGKPVSHLSGNRRRRAERGEGGGIRINELHTRPPSRGATAQASADSSREEPAG